MTPATPLNGVNMGLMVGEFQKCPNIIKKHINYSSSHTESEKKHAECNLLYLLLP